MLLPTKIQHESTNFLCNKRPTGTAPAATHVHFSGTLRLLHFSRRATRDSTDDTVSTLESAVSCSLVHTTNTEHQSCRDLHVLRSSAKPVTKCHFKCLTLECSSPRSRPGSRHRPRRTHAQPRQSAHLQHPVPDCPSRRPPHAALSLRISVPSTARPHIHKLTRRSLVGGRDALRTLERGLHLYLW